MTRETTEISIFSADWHIGHYNIIGYCDRPFQSVKEMDETILEGLERFSVPGVKTTLYFLGDLTMNRSLIYRPLRQIEQLGFSLVFLWGNHDSNKTKSAVIESSVTDNVGDIINLSIGTDNFVLCHYPLRSWNGIGRGSLQLHGHCHNNLPPLKNQLDVGVDSAYRLFGEFRPFTLQDIKNVINTQLPQAEIYQ